MSLQYIIAEQLDRIEIFRISAGCRTYGRSGCAHFIFAERKNSERQNLESLQSDNGIYRWIPDRIA